MSSLPEQPSASPPPRLRRSDLALAALVVAVGAGGYLLAGHFAAHGDQSLPVAACDLNAGTCQQALPGGGTLHFSINPYPVPALQPLHLQAYIDGRSVRSVSVDIAGADMEMGHQRPTLASSDGSRFSAQASLPVCTTGRMLWQATVLIDTGEGVISAPFQFAAGGQ